MPMGCPIRWRISWAEGLTTARSIIVRVRLSSFRRRMTLPPPQTSSTVPGANWPKAPDTKILNAAKADSRRPAPSEDSQLPDRYAVQPEGGPSRRERVQQVLGHAHVLKRMGPGWRPPVNRVVSDRPAAQISDRPAGDLSGGGSDAAGRCQIRAAAAVLLNAGLVRLSRAAAHLLAGSGNAAARPERRRRWRCQPSRWAQRPPAAGGDVPPGQIFGQQPPPPQKKCPLGPGWLGCQEQPQLLGPTQAQAQSGTAGAQQQSASDDQGPVPPGQLFRQARLRFSSIACSTAGSAVRSNRGCRRAGLGQGAPTCPEIHLRRGLWPVTTCRRDRDREA